MEDPKNIVSPLSGLSSIRLTNENGNGNHTQVNAKKADNAGGGP